MLDLVDEAHLNALRGASRAAMSARDSYYFGFQPYSDTSTSGRFGAVVGVGRLPQAPDRPLVVGARQFGNSSFQVDHVRLYEICASDPIVSDHLGACFSIYPDEEPVEVPDADDWSRLIALAYLKALHDLTRRHMRRGFVAREEDLRGRVRGQIRTARYVTKSLTRGHPEIVPCWFQELQSDTLENRILRTALAAARRLLDGGGGDAWHQWARSADAALAGAAITRIMPKDFRSARRNGSYRHYAKPLDLAKAVLTRAGFDPNNPLQGETARLVPFRLLTYELFERYVEVCLRRCAGWGIRAGYHKGNIGKDFKIRPDFVAWNKGNGVIVDAKYKDFAKQAPGAADSDNGLRADVYQVMAYSRHREAKVLMSNGSEPFVPSAAILVYPGCSNGAAPPVEAARSLLAALFSAAAGSAQAERQPNVPCKSYEDFDIGLITCCLPTPCRG